MKINISIAGFGLGFYEDTNRHNMAPFFSANSQCCFDRTLILSLHYQRDMQGELIRSVSSTFKIHESSRISLAGLLGSVYVFQNADLSHWP